MTTSIPLPTEPPATVGATVRATINGREVEVASGTTILEAARACGVRIPTLCHHPDLPDVGVCRVCVVEVAGQVNLQPSCVLSLIHI